MIFFIENLHVFALFLQDDHYRRFRKKCIVFDSNIITALKFLNVNFGLPSRRSQGLCHCLRLVCFVRMTFMFPPLFVQRRRRGAKGASKRNLRRCWNNRKKFICELSVNPSQLRKTQACELAFHLLLTLSSCFCNNSLPIAWWYNATMTIYFLISRIDVVNLITRL